MKKEKQILFFGFVLIVLGMSFEVSPIQAQPYPNRSIQVVISGAPGEAVDLAGRMVVEEMEKILKIPVVTLNKPGGGASIGTDFVAKSKKDGYTILYTPSSGVVYNPAFNPEATPYDTLRDLEPLALHVSFPVVFCVQAEGPWKNFPEVIEYAKKNPGKFRCGTLGVGSIDHFRLEVIKSVAGVDITMVPFKGAMPALTALLGGHVEGSLSAATIFRPHYKSGKLRGILIDHRVPDLPDIPSLHELGYKQNLPSSWFGFFAPAGLPDDAKKILVPAIEKAIKNPEGVAKLQKMGLITNYKSPTEQKQVVMDDYEKAREMVKRMGLTK